MDGGRASKTETTRSQYQMTSTMIEPKYPLPPYGKLSEEYTGRLRARPVVPPDWEMKDGCDAACRLAQWNDFKQHILDLISDVLWPVYDAVRHEWSCGAAAEFMVPLTALDLRFLI